jgi:hypothetical protein
MIVLLMEQYSLSVGFLHLLSCFRDRYLPTEEGFTGSSRLVETADKVGKFDSRLPTIGKHY